MQLKTFKTTDLNVLEMLVNNWLYEMMPEKPQMQYATGWSVENCPEYSVILLYDNPVSFGGMDRYATKARRTVEASL